MFEPILSWLSLVEQVLPVKTVWFPVWLVGLLCNHERSGSNMFWPGTLQQACRVKKWTSWFKSRGRQVVQRLVGLTYWLRDKWFKHMFDLASWYKLAGSKVVWTKLVPVGSTILWPGKLAQTCPSLYKLAGSKTCWTNLVQQTFDLASLYKLARSKSCFEPSWFK